MKTGRQGFTLFELLVAIVLTGVVALLAYGTAAAGFDTRDRLARYRATVEAQMIVRDLLVDALRHPPETGGAAMNDTLFLLIDRTGADGTPTDEIAFFSRGLTPPLGVAATWALTLSHSVQGLRVRATAPAPAPAAQVDALLPAVHGLNVRVLDRTGDVLWSDRWDAPGRVPAAVALEFFTAAGTRAGPPLVVHAALERVR